MTRSSDEPVNNSLHQWWNQMAQEASPVPAPARLRARLRQRVRRELAQREAPPPPRRIVGPPEGLRRTDVVRVPHTLWATATSESIAVRPRAGIFVDVPLALVPEDCFHRFWRGLTVTQRRDLLAHPGGSVPIVPPEPPDRPVATVPLLEVERL